MATVSIVMATYNGARFLDEQLTSLAAQYRAPDELIVSDDGSTDATLEIVEKFRAAVPFPVVVRRNAHRLGYGENFLSAAQLASGDFIAFCDQDDVWRPEKLQVAVDRLVETNAELLVHPATIIDDSGRRRGQFTQGIAKSETHGPLRLAPWSVFYGCCMVFRRRLLALVDPAARGRHTFEHTGLLSHDLWVYFLATSLGTVVAEDRPLIDYRQHNTNATPALSRGGLRSWLRSLGLPANAALARDDIARQRCALLTELSRSARDATARQAAAHAAAYWHRIAEHEASRLDLYAAGSPVHRAWRFSTLVASGGYRSSPRAGLGARLLLKDLLVGVLRADRLSV